VGVAAVGLALPEAKGADPGALRVAIVGGFRHSRVARSGVHALRAQGIGEVRACAPAALLPEDGLLEGCAVVDDLDAALEGVDAVFMLRLQRERMLEGLVPSLEADRKSARLNSSHLVISYAVSCWKKSKCAERGA